VHQGTDEPLDVLDENGLPTGRTKGRQAVHVDGDWHRAIHIWVVREGRMVVLQRRALTKDLEAGKLDVSVGGHYRAGELFVNVLREAEEEIGLALRPGQLTYLGTARSERRYPDAEPPLVDREFQEVYVVRDERPLEAYDLGPDEVDTLYELPVERAIELFEEGRHTAAAGFDAMRRPSNALLYEADLPSQGRALHAQALRRIRAWLDGEPVDELAQLPLV
jgi:isopentenyldiphosphate isomerase